MITYHTCHAHGDAVPGSDAAGGIPPGAVWIDVKEPTDDEVASLERATGLTLPTYAQLSEVESSSRLRQEDAVLFLSLPVVHRSRSQEPRTAPVGLVLSPPYLVTLRYADLKAFDSFATRLEQRDFEHPTTVNVFVGLLEAVVDRLADILEDSGGDLDEVADQIFGAAEPDGGAPVAAKAQDRLLRSLLRRLGRNRQLISKVRATLLGLDRIVPFVEGQGKAWLPDGAKSRLRTLRQDVASLDEFEARLSDKIQFLLDATLGMISIEQNDTFRVLTIVSVVGIPPTLVASMYGMNFKNMPELEWHYGYAWGLGLIFLSAVLPMMFFRRKGWF